MLKMKELVNGRVIKQHIAYPTLMRRQIKKHTDFLQPFYEAFSNAIESLFGVDDAICVKLKMAKKNLFNENDLSFVSLEVCDTGKGFDTENYERFLNLYDESKDFHNFGTGRIQYLHFFEHTEINSIYEENGQLYKRRLVLSSKFYENENGVIWAGEPEMAGEDEHVGTSVEFFLLYSEEDKEKYDKLTTKDLRDKIFLRYLGRFCMDKGHLPEIKFEQYITNVHVDGEDQYIRASDIPDSDYSDDFELCYKKVAPNGEGFDTLSKKEKFFVKSFLLPKSIQKKNEVKYSSKNETVDASRIDNEAINRLSDINGMHMLCLISGDYLTNQDSDERGKIKIYTKADYIKRRNLWDADEELIFVDDIQGEVNKKLVNRYPEVKKVEDDINNDLDEVIEMFSMDRGVIEKMGSVSGEGTAEFISRYTQYNAEIEAKGKAKIKSEFDALKELDPTKSGYTDEVKKRSGKIAKMIPESNRATLTRYISERKSALVMLDKIIAKQLEIQQRIEAKKRKKNEKIIHNLLFKQKSNSPIDSNLWMLNEDFIHFKGVSESELRKVMIGGETFLREDLTDEELEQLNSYNRDYLGNRLDILLFPSEHKCIIIELKSLDADVSKFTTQATRYASLIRKYSKDKFEITNFYAYLLGENFDFEAVVDADPDFLHSPNLDYVYNPDQKVNGNDKRSKGTMYIEVLKYSTLLERAKLRNKAFIDPLFKGVDETKEG